jgi:hypothetical protein
MSLEEETCDICGRKVKILSICAKCGSSFGWCCALSDSFCTRCEEQLSNEAEWAEYAKYN